LDVGAVDPIGDGFGVFALGFRKAAVAVIPCVGGIIFHRDSGGVLVISRKESGGFAAADRLAQLGEMAKGFIKAVECNYSGIIEK
jgi:hypothetical protein